jgi:hypothetical protein
MGNILEKSCIEIQNTHFMFSTSFSENRTVYEMMSKNMVETEGPQMTSQHGAYALHAGLARLHAQAHAPGCQHASTHAQTNMYYLLHFHGNNDRNAPQSYVMHTLPVLFV